MAAGHPFATITAGYGGLPVELSAAWTTKGQHWRIEKEIRSCVDRAAAAAEQLRREIGDLQQRAADATRRIGEPFPRAAELEAARARRDVIEQDIRDAAAPPDDNSTAAPPGCDDLSAAAAHDARAMAGMHDAQEITCTPAMISPPMAALTEDAEHADAPAFRVAAAQDAPASQPAGDQLAATAPGEPARAGRDGSPEEPAVPAVVTPAEITAGKPAPPRLAVTHPALLARLDGTAEPLFPLPPAAPEHPAGGQAAQAGRPARRRPARRPAEQTTAADSAAQPALFDLPPPPAPRRPATADQSRTRTSRK